MRLNIPAIDDIKMINTGHRLPMLMPVSALGSYTEAEISMEERPEWMEMHRMEIRAVVQQAIPCHARREHRYFVERQMRRELVRHLYGNILDYIREAERTARMEGAAQTQQWLGRIVKGLASLMEDEE